MCFLAGDVLVAVGGRSVAGLGRREVAELLKEAGDVVKLSVRPATTNSSSQAAAAEEEEEEEEGGAG